MFSLTLSSEMAFTSHITDTDIHMDNGKICVSFFKIFILEVVYQSELLWSKYTLKKGKSWY